MDTSQLFISRGVKVAVHVREGDVYPGDVLRGVVEVRCGYRHRDEPTALASLAVSFKCLERAVIGGLMSVDVNPEAKKSVYLNDRIQLVGTPPQGGATWLSPGASLAAAPPPHAPHGGEEANNTQHRHHHSHSSRTNGSLQADDLDYPHLQELCHAALPMEEGVYTFPFFVVLPYTIPPSLKVYDAGNARCALWYVLCADLCLVSGKRLVSEEVPVEVKPLPLPLHRWVETMEGIQRQREEAERARMNGTSSSNKKKGDEDGSRPQTSSSSPPPLQNAPMEGSIATATATDYYGPDISMEALRREERTLRHTLRIDELYPKNIMHEWRQADYEHRDGQNRARIRRALSLLAPINGTITTTTNNNIASATPPSSVPRQQRLDAATPGSSTSRSSKKMSVPVCRPEDGPMMQGNYVPELNDVQSRQAFFDRASLTSAQQGLPGGELEPYDCEMERCSHIFVVPLRFGIFTGSRMIPLRVDMMSAVLTPGQKHQLSLNLTIDNSKGKADIGKVELHLVTRITVHSKYEEYSFDRSHPVVRMGDVVPKGIIATLPTIHVPVPEDLPISVRTHGCSKATFLCVRMASLTKPVHYHRSVEMELLVVGGVDLLGQSRRLERWSCNFGEMRFPHKEENKAYMVDQTAFCSPKVMVLLTVKEALQRFALAATNSRRFSSADTIKHMKATERPTSSSESQEPFRNEPFDWHRPTFVPRPVEPSSHHVDPHPNPLTFASSLPFEFDGSASD